MSFLTIFTASKPFTNPHIATIQRNAILSWLELGSDVEVIMIGDEPGIGEFAAEHGIRHIPEVERNAQGTPLLSSIFDLARRATDSPLLAYLNADILLLPDFLASTRQVSEQLPRFLIVGQRWDLEVCEPLDISAGWQAQMQERLRQNGKLHPPMGSDYFVYPRACFQEMPRFAVGRAGWDNWMFYEARCKGWPVVDATASIQIVHQNHDYSHLPGGQPHYRLPETGENIRRAGGRRTIFTLLDANRRLVDGKLAAPKLTAKKFWREVEIFPLVSLHSYALGQVAFSIFHPRKAYQELRKWMKGNTSYIKGQ